MPALADPPAHPRTSAFHQAGGKKKIPIVSSEWVMERETNRPPCPLIELGLLLRHEKFTMTKKTLLSAHSVEQDRSAQHGITHRAFHNGFQRYPMMPSDPHVQPTETQSCHSPNMSSSSVEWEIFTSADMTVELCVCVCVCV